MSLCGNHAKADTEVRTSEQETTQVVSPRNTPEEGEEGGGREKSHGHFRRHTGAQSHKNALRNVYNEPELSQQSWGPEGLILRLLWLLVEDLPNVVLNPQDVYTVL